MDTNNIVERAGGNGVRPVPNWNVSKFVQENCVREL